ncbi:M56 family metallopeptidase [Cyclobacterium sp.]|uniref:M56 family metallopeptidase n=1 Tax=Cyclobacterium sp. TaxID=1966343 RepID=UPI0019BADCAF|nr:M56 family metallopeptidase [Cyclobacterium sp.]MBD3627317.1 M56 family metallopeptidase [Cyclobacterium sp.]
MEAILYYLLKVSISTVVFFCTYHFLLKRIKQFVFNRIYLAGSFLVGFIIPLITFQSTSYFSGTTTYFSGNGSTGFLPAETNVASYVSGMEITGLLFFLYLCGLAFCMAKLIFGFVKAARIRKSCTEKMVSGRKVWIAQEKDLAFTFMDNIIIGKNLLHHPSLEMILNHEAVHSRERHCFDIVLAELLLILQWFNPIARFHAQAIRNNLEFRADDRVIRESDKQEYQFTMLSMALNRINSQLFTAINSSNLQKRIIMMNTKNKNRYSSLTRLAIVPVFALLLVSLSAKKTVRISESGSDLDPSIELMQERPSDPIHSNSEIIRFFTENLKYPTEARKAVLTGTARIYARVNPHGHISEVLDVRPEEDYLEFDEIVIIGYADNGAEELKKTKSYSHPSLLAEGRRVVESIPRLEIADLQGKMVQFNFKFDIQKTN